MAIQLDFSSQWEDNVSPITLQFGVSVNGITLEFDTAWQDRQSPIQLYFGDAPPVDPPTVDTSIGIEIGIGWLSPQAIEQLIALQNQTTRVGSQTAVSWHSDNAVETEVTLAQHTGELQAIHLLTAWQSAAALQRNIGIAWALPDLLTHHTALAWLDGVGHQTNTELVWQNREAIHSETELAWAGIDVGTQLAISYSDNSAVGDEKGIAWGPHQPKWVCSTRYRPPEPGLITLTFTDPFETNQSPLVLAFTASENYCYYDNGGGSIEANPTLPSFDFKIPIAPQIRRSYLMQPQISCIRMSDSLPVVLKSVSISQSRSQWASSGSVTFSSRIDAEHADNELLKISINGYDFYLWCEGTSESKAFGQSRYSASCRGRFAELSAPYIKATNFVNTTARSFMGLMGDIIQYMGWTLVSEITDYTVPANAFSYAAKTPAEALNMMAAAIGAMLDIDEETKTITVIPQWPTVPWDVASAVPDVILHDGVILEFSEKREIRTDANAVFVRGEQQGVAVKVKRTGSAGDEFAADVVDKLITDNQAGRMRGTIELANAGNKVQNTIRTKVMADLPPMRPGMLIGVTKGADVFKSVCDAVTISASVNGSTGEVTVNQSVTLLRNEVTA